MSGIGYGQVMATAAVLTYYVSLMAITLFYLVASFQVTFLPGSQFEYQGAGWMWKYFGGDAVGR